MVIKMKIVYVASRYHTNQIPVVKGWIDRDDEVIFLSQFQSGSEDYSLLTPRIMGYSRIFQKIHSGYTFLQRKKLKEAAIPAYFKAQFGFPSFKKIANFLKVEKPDVVIMRDRCVYNAVVNHYCKKYKISAILYNQTPFFEEKEDKTDIFHQVIRKACPTLRMTPVYGQDGENKEIKQHVHFVPFVVNPVVSIQEKEHFLGDKINILCIGKYEKRKHHIELLETVANLENRKEIQLTLVGECSRESHQAYLERLEKCVREVGMEEQVKICQNFSLEQVYEVYKKTDLFVLPSTGEFASISQLEAMSCSVPVICSSTNGTGNCVVEGETGYLFTDKDFLDLKEKIKVATKNREQLLQMGEKSYRRIEEAYNFEKYYNKIMRMINESKEQF